MIITVNQCYVGKKKIYIFEYSISHFWLFNWLLNGFFSQYFKVYARGGQYDQYHFISR